VARPYQYLDKAPRNVQILPDCGFAPNIPIMADLLNDSKTARKNLLGSGCDKFCMVACSSFRVQM
jgi:hypothetical protein